MSFIAQNSDFLAILTKNFSIGGPITSYLSYPYVKFIVLCFT